MVYYQNVYVIIYEFRNLLKDGIHEVYMWPVPRTSGKDPEDPKIFYCDPNPIGPIANNPDSSAVQLTLEFESWDHPVIFPNDVLETTIPHMPRWEVEEKECYI